MESNNPNSSKQRKSASSLAIALAALITVVASGLTTYVFLELKFDEPINITIADWIKVVLPILGSGLIVIFAFLGIDRLKNFDERQDKLSKELKEELKTTVNDATSVYKSRFEEILKEKTDSFAENLSLYEEKLTHVGKQIDEYNTKWGDLKERRTVTDAIGNISEAHDYIQKQFQIEMSNDSMQWQIRTKSLDALVKRIISEEIKGNSADYHNLAVELARQNYYDQACEVIGKGLQFFPYDIDLLSDALAYIHTFNNAHEMAERSIKTLESIGRNGWNWRTFTFYIDYLNGLEPSDENKNKALDLIKDYKKLLPDEERAYMAEYETFRKYGEIKNAEEALEYAEENFDMTAQCSLILSEIYRRKGEYDKAYFSATRAIQSQAEDQPSSHTGAAFANRAFALDAKIFNKRLKGQEVEQSMITDAIADYKMAEQFGFRLPNIQARVIILRSFLPHEEQEAFSIEELKQRVDTLEKLIMAFIESLQDDEK